MVDFPDSVLVCPTKQLLLLDTIREAWTNWSKHSRKMGIRQVSYDDEKYPYPILYSGWSIGITIMGHNNPKETKSPVNPFNHNQSTEIWSMVQIIGHPPCMACSTSKHGIPEDSHKANRFLSTVFSHPSNGELTCQRSCSRWLPASWAVYLY